MHRPNLRGIDLNLLVILRVLLEERNTTRAAERLAMSQPAVSRALSRLRSMYHDPLLIRTPQGMEPTIRALELLAPLRQILRSVEQTLQPLTPPCPTEFTGVLRIAAHSYVEYVMLPGLIEQLHRDAPQLTIQIVPLCSNYDRQLDEGQVSMVIMRHENVPSRFDTLPLLDDRLMCVANHHHPLAGKRIDYQTFAAADHLVVAPRGSEGGVLDDLLARRGLARHTQLIVQSFLAAPFILARSSLLLTAPVRILEPMKEALKLREIHTQFALPRFVVSQIRHRRDDNHAALNWFCQQLQQWCHTLQAECRELLPA